MKGNLILSLKRMYPWYTNGFGK